MEQLYFYNLFKVYSEYKNGYRHYKCVAAKQSWAVLVDVLNESCIILDRNSKVSELMQFKPV